MFVFVSSYAQRIFQKLFIANDTIVAAATNLETIASPLEQPGAPVTPSDLPVPPPFLWDYLGWGTFPEPEWCVKHVWAFWMWNTIYGPRSKDTREFREFLCAVPEIVLTYWCTRLFNVLLWACKRWNWLLAEIERILVTVTVEIVATIACRRVPFLKRLITAVWNCVRNGPRFMWIFLWELRRSLRAVYGRHRELVAL